MRATTNKSDQIQLRTTGRKVFSKIFISVYNKENIRKFQR